MSSDPNKTDRTEKTNGASEKAFSWDEHLRQRLLGFKTRWNWSYAQISRDMTMFYGKRKDESGRNKNVGMGQSTIYAYAECKWTQNSSQQALERFEGRLRGWLDHAEHGGQTENIDLSVRSAKLIDLGLREAYLSRKFVLIAGPSGQGKSLLLRHYRNTTTRGDMRIVEAYDGMTARAFLAAICRALGEIDTGSVDHLIMRAAGVLAEHPRVIAIDEANFLKSQSINQLVYIYNQARMGVVLLGTRELERIAHDSDLERVQTRFKVIIQLPLLNEDEVKVRLLKSFDRAAVTARVVDLAQRGSGQSYRALDTVIESAADYLDRNDGKGKSLEHAFERTSTRMIAANKERKTA